MTEIKPRIVDGEPWCDKGCPMVYGKYFETSGYLEFCKVENLRVTSKYPCIPMLRQQRDQLAAENERLKEDLDEARREVCKEICAALWHPESPETITPSDIAKQRGWDCFEVKR